MSVYDFTVKGQDGADVSLESVAGKVLLIVNTATECGFTPQYADLQKLYNEFHEQGLEILDFPCNQFGAQAPGEDEEIHLFCTGRFGITFPQFAKIDVNGEQAIPLYQWLTMNTEFGGFSGPHKDLMDSIAAQMDPDYKNNGDIKWNFTKFIINRKGNIVARFEPTDDMADVREKILALI